MRSSLCSPPRPVSSLFSASYDGAVLFLRVESQRGHRPDDGQASRLRAQAGGTLGDPDGCGDRHPIGGDDGERRAFGLRRGQESQGAQATPRRRRRRAPARARRPRGFGAGSGRSSGGDPRSAGEGTADQENLGGRRIRGEKLASALTKLGLGIDLEIVKKPKNIKGFTVLYRRWVVERTFAWMSRCRRLAKDYERSLESSLAWAQLAACRFMMRRIARATTC